MTWRPQSANGWFPKLSPDGTRALYGFWITTVADLTTGVERVVASPQGGRLNPAGWLDNDYFIAHAEDAPAQVYRIAFADLSTVALGPYGQANWSCARDGHWAMSVTNRPFLIRDGQPFRQDLNQYGGVQLAGDHTVVGGNGGEVIFHFTGDQLTRTLPGDNAYRVNADGDLASGYFGPVRLFPAGQGMVDATISPNRREGVPALVRVNGELWLWSAIEDLGEHMNSSIIGRKLGETKPILLRNFPAVDVYAVWDGTQFVIAGNDTNGTMQVRWVDANAERTDLTTIHPVDPIVAINKPCWLGWFEFAQPPSFAPGNAWLNVFFAGGTGAIKHVGDGVTFAQWVQGNTVEEIELKAGGASRPVVAYWDARQWLRWPVLPDNSWLALQTYRRIDETPAQFEADMRREIQRASIAGYKRIALVCQCYTSNLSLTSDLASNVPVYARLARDFSQVSMLLVFSDQGRATGLNDHPELLPLWRALAAGIPSAPLDTTPDPEPEDPMPSGPTLHDWTILEFPQTVDARRTHLNDQTWQPDPAWVILQMARRYGFGLPPGEAPWSLQKMINHELNPEGH